MPIAEPAQSKPFSLGQFERYDLQSQLIDTTCQIALKNKVVSEALLEKLGIAVSKIPTAIVSQQELKIERTRREARIKALKKHNLSDEEIENIEQSGTDYESLLIEPNSNLIYLSNRFRTAPEEEKAKIFADLIQKAELKDKEPEELGNLMMLLVPVMNAANSAKERDYPNHLAGQVFKNFLTSGLKVVADGKNTFGQRPEEWLEHLTEAKEKLILSVVNTSHPTNFHTPEGRKYEADLIAFMKLVDTKNNNVIQDEKLQNKFNEKIAKACEQINSGIMFTYTKKVTVGEEMDTEAEVRKAQQEAIAEVFKAWDTAIASPEVKKQATEAGRGLSDKLNALQLTDAEKEKIYEQRSWVLGGADKDGRDESTDTVFYKAYRDALNNNGIYEGPIMDLRDNAEVRRKTLDALIAERYSRNETFREACNAFCEGKTNNELGEYWRGSGSSVYQQLSEENRCEFLEDLMKKNLPLMNQDAVRSEAVGFNQEFYKIYPELLADYELPKHTPIYKLTPDQYDDLLGRMSEVESTLVIGKGRDDRANGFSFHSVFGSRPNENAKPGKNNRRTKVGIIYNHLGFGSPLIDGHKTLNPNFDPSQPEIPKANSLLSSMNSLESLSCMAYLRRLFMVDHVLEEQKGKVPPEKIVEREQSANFENASDFFAQLYLFQQAGLVTIENGKVTEAKIGIQPLFETTPEMLRGPDIIDAILKSDLAKSYYEARGKAEFMVGYSDGAKSGGNFASHVRIREFERMLTEKFKATFGEDFEVRILRGPGRGENRGGVRKYDNQYVLHHDSVNKNPVNDQTIQGDLAIRMQMDPNFATRTYAEMLVSTLSGAVKGRHAAEIEKKDDDVSKLQVARTKSFEAAINFIADHSEEKYRTGIFEKEKECDDVIKTVIRNPEATSRAQVRADTKKTGIGPIRAITVEYASNISGIPLHDYGLNKALEAFAASGQAVLDKDGKAVTGDEALKVLAKDCDFFREELKLCSIRQQSLNPTIARIWAKKAKQEAFVEDIIKNLSGLGDKCEQLLSGDTQAKAKPREDFSGEPFMHAFFDVVQAVFAANPDMEKTVKQRLYFALQAPISERPASHARSETPGYALGA